MIVETTRFGSIPVADEDIITFSEGMLGFSKIDSYVLVERTDDSLFLWLQAVKKPSVAFPLLEPQILERNYKVELEDEDRKALKLEPELTGGKVLCIITIPTDPTKMTANLKAPIVINLKKRIAKQVILHSQDYPIRKAIFSDLQQHCATNQRSIFPVTDATSYQAIHITEEMGSIIKNI
jgi:flagellar assembly factor FliW